MRAWRRWSSVALFGGVAIVAAYLIGSAPVSAALQGCQECTCKNTYVWKSLNDNFGQGLVDANGTAVMDGITGLCVLNCPNTPNLTNHNLLDRHEYSNPQITCDNSSNPPSTCSRTVQEASGTLTTTILGQTTQAVCAAPGGGGNSPGR